jgi:hypothetical protein
MARSTATIVVTSIYSTAKPAELAEFLMVSLCVLGGPGGYRDFFNGVVMGPRRLAVAG